ncbi:MAG: hypothetical protein Q8K22_15810 [Rhodoferax sp.]|jgi:colicin import membrane protein|nr:hypothetical protein [Rhodoferax sp.]
MSRLLVLMLLILSSALSAAQDVNIAAKSLDISVERARIQSERDVGESRFGEQTAACYAKFAVTDCLQEVRLRRRQLNDELRRQTVVLNDMERRKKTLLKMEQTELKSSFQKAE